MSEHDKLALAQERSQEIGNFLEWLSGEELVICRWKERYSETVDIEPSFFYPSGKIIHTDQAEFLPANENVEKLLARYFGIDLDLLEQEKREMLEKCNKENQ